MGRALLLCVAGVCFAACQPLYGDRPEKLHTPEKKKPPVDANAGKEVKITYIEECNNVTFTDDAKKWKNINPTKASQLVEAGDSSQQLADKAKDAQAKVSAIQVALGKYREALTQDPYNAQATLKLAMEYDLLQRKGCAIAMLKRLSSLTNNPKWQRQAQLQIESIVDNSGWFKNYRKDALQAVGK
jgi:hypothetical protein